MASENAQRFSFSSSSFSEIRWKYDVFLNFRGEDTRNRFTDHLYVALDQKRFITFMDDARLERGRSISSELLDAIEKSRLSVVILSKNYASSTWCLDELVKIVECMEIRKQYVVPVFYYIDPSDVQNQEGDFKEAFDYYEQEFKDNNINMKKVESWKQALKKVAGIDSRLHLLDSPEAQFIKDIVDEISRNLLIGSWKYDVFISFRGKDTRNNFTDHLYRALDMKGIKAFRDDTLLERGREIPPNLLESIEHSRSSIIIFSPNYASSTWCLDELVKIVKCMHEWNQTVFPIYYDVDPSDVRRQTGCFRKAFDRHYEYFKNDKLETVERWKAALREVSDLSGWLLMNRSEAKFIKDVVDEIWKRLRGTFL